MTALILIAAVCWTEPPQWHLLVFCADWCVPCKTLHHDLDANETKASLAGYTVWRLEWNEWPGCRKQWRIEAVPTMVILRGRTEVDRRVGYDGDANRLRRWFRFVRTRK